MRKTILRFKSAGEFRAKQQKLNETAALLLSVKVSGVQLDSIRKRVSPIAENCVAPFMYIFKYIWKTENPIWYCQRGGGECAFIIFFFIFWACSTRLERAQLCWSVRSSAGGSAMRFYVFFSFSERAQLGWSVRSYAGACACASKQKNIKAHPPPPAPLFGSTLC